MDGCIYVNEILEELRRNAAQIKDEELQKTASSILAAKRVFVAGAGRSGFAARAFSNRLMHLGLTAYFAGEPTTPAAREGDLLFIISGSGSTPSLVMMAEKARACGASVATVTIHPDGPVGQCAEAVLCLPGAEKSGQNNTAESVQIMGDAFEQLSWIVCDAMVHYMREKLGISKEEMYLRHANLE